jgi:Type IV secretion-system coupling protein DNA-binding domain
MPWLVQMTVLLLLCYVAGVTRYHWSEIRRLRQWTELVSLRGGAPWGPGHTQGALVGTTVVAALILRDFFNRQPMRMSRRLLRGRPLVAFGRVLEWNRQWLAEPNIATLVSLMGSVKWGGISIPTAALAKPHSCIIGTSGSGKSLCIKLLFHSIVQLLNPRGRMRAVIYDSKRDTVGLLSSWGCQIPYHILNPFDDRASVWAMNEDVGSPKDAYELASILIPADDKPFWTVAPRTVFSAVIEFFHRNARREKTEHGEFPAWTLRDVVLALEHEDTLITILSSDPSTRMIARRYLQARPEIAADILATLMNTVRQLSFVAVAWQTATQSISAKRFVRGESIVVLGCDPTSETILERLNAAFLDRMTQEVLLQPENDPTRFPQSVTWVILDELRRAGKFEKLGELMTEGRSKGAKVVLGFQNVPGMMEVYGEHKTNELMALCANMAFLKLDDPKSQEQAVAHFGDADYETRTWAQSSSSTGSVGGGSSTTSGINETVHLETKPILLTTDLKDLPEGNPSNGVTGYFDTDCVGAPYCGGPSPADFAEMLSGGSARQSDYIPQTGQDTLRPWDMADLERLGLKDHPELLTPNWGSPQNTKGKARTTQSSLDDVR